MADLGWPEIMVIAIVVFALFGWRRLPDASRALGRSIRIFRAETSELASGSRVGPDRDDDPEHEIGEEGDH
jgi:sec-independent protein translocase protein TatA